MPQWAYGNFLNGDYETKLSRTELRIDHISPHSQCSLHNRRRGCVIALSYAEPVVGHTTALELPLFSEDHLGFYGWVPATAGDYIIHLNGDQLNSPVAQILISARF